MTAGGAKVLILRGAGVQRGLRTAPGTRGTVKAWTRAASRP